MDATTVLIIALVVLLIIGAYLVWSRTTAAKRTRVSFLGVEAEAQQSSTPRDVEITQDGIRNKFSATKGVTTTASQKGSENEIKIG